MRLWVFSAAVLFSACATVQDTAPSTSDAALTAMIRNARVRECPPGRTLANARTTMDGKAVGVETAHIALMPLAHDPSHAVALRWLVVAPGGVIAWHDHKAVQGLALIVSGEITEFRNTCLDPIVYRAGDVVLEDAGTAHGGRNESGREVVLLVAHVVPR